VVKVLLQRTGRGQLQDIQSNGRGIIEEKNKAHLAPPNIPPSKYDVWWLRNDGKLRTMSRLLQAILGKVAESHVSEAIILHV
jgi:hypothetical protein